MVVPSVDDADRAAEEETQKHHADWWDAFNGLLNAYLSAFHAVGQFKVSENNRLQQMLLRSVSRSFNSLHQALNLWTATYYSQSIILARSVLEDWLVCMDALSHEETIDALANRERPITFKAMAERSLTAELIEWFYGGSTPENEGIYGFLSTFSHPRSRALAVQIDSGQDGNSLRLGPRYNQILATVTYSSITEVAVKMAEFAFRMIPAGKQNEVYSSHMSPAMDTAKQRLHEAWVKAKAMLDE